MWLALFLGGYKWYQSNLVILCGAKVLHGVGPNEDIGDLSWEIVTPQKVSPTLRK